MAPGGPAECPAHTWLKPTMRHVPPVLGLGLPIPSVRHDPTQGVPRPRPSPQHQAAAGGLPAGLAAHPCAPSKDDVERCKQKDLLEQMMAEMIGEFPDLHRTIVSERDVYLTYMLRQAARRLELPRSSDSECRLGGAPWEPVAAGWVLMGCSPHS